MLTILILFTISIFILALFHKEKPTNSTENPYMNETKQISTNEHNEEIFREDEKVKRKKINGATEDKTQSLYMYSSQFHSSKSELKDEVERYNDEEFEIYDTEEIKEYDDVDNVFEDSGSYDRDSYNLDEYNRSKNDFEFDRDK